MYIYRVYVKRYMIFQRRHVFQNEICFPKRDMFFKQNEKRSSTYAYSNAP